MKSRVTVKWLMTHYTKREVMIPMRDGVRLYTALYEPKEGDAHPVIMERSPYGFHPYGKTFSRDLRSRLDAFVEAGYIIVFQNVRGSYLSEGQFENIRPYNPHKQGNETDEASDAWDTTEWIVNNCRTNGSIGVKGISYPGFYATLAALSGHPAIKAVSPQAPVTDWFLGDDAHLGGAFQYALTTFGASFFRPRTKPCIRWPKPVFPITGEYYRFFLDRGLKGMNDLLTGQVDFWDEMPHHPTYDAWWKERNPARHLTQVRPAMLVVGGWFDGEDCYGTLETWRRLKAQSPQTPAFLAMGPWYHGGWKKKGYSELGPADFGAGSAEYFLYDIEFPFFRHFLENQADERFSKTESVAFILPSAETQPGKASAHQWECLPAWPPQNEIQTWYLSGTGRLSRRQGSQTCAFCSNPKHPVPYQAEPGMGWDRSAQVADQRFAARRPDVLVFKSAALKTPLKVEGPVTVHLEVTMDAEDADLVVKLIDRRPDGVQMLVRAGVLPARFRGGFEQAVPVRPGERTVLEWTLNDIAHHFQPGHRLMVQVQGSWFPQIAMNPQRWFSNPFCAGPQDARPALITLHPESRIEIPVVPDDPVE